jgi:hypothetical protein
VERGCQMPDARCRMPVGRRIPGGTGGLSTRELLTAVTRHASSSKSVYDLERLGLTRNVGAMQTMQAWKLGRFDQPPCHPVRNV